MKTLTTLLSVLCLAASAQAEVIIYRQSYTQTIQGDNASSQVKFTGYFFFDSAGADAPIQIDVSTKTKTFQVYRFSDFFVDYIRPSPIRQDLVLSKSGGKVGAFFAKGRVVSVDVQGNSFNLPRALAVTGMAIDGEGSAARVYQYKGTFTYDVGLTGSASNGLEQVLHHLVDALTAKGYREIL